MSGTGSGQVIQDALGLAGHTQSAEEQLTLERGKEKWVIKNLENATFSWVLKNAGQFSGLGFLPLAYCVTQGKLSPSLTSFLFFKIEGPAPFTTKGRGGEINAGQRYRVTQETRSSILFSVETTPSPPPLPQEEVSPAAQWGRVTCFSPL